MKLLIIEDDTDINKLIQKILKRESYEVVPAYSGTEGLLRLEHERFDMVICDLMLPGISGEEVIRTLRTRSDTPCIVLTAKSALEDKITVLDMGADDYMTKPFEPRELMARVNVQLRKAARLESAGSKEDAQTEEITLRNLVMSPLSRTVTVKGAEIKLTAHEFAILKIMLENPKRVFSKEALYEAVWDNGYYGEDNTISVHISNIRKKIAQVDEEEYISTVWGIGFKIHL